MFKNIFPFKDGNILFNDINVSEFQTNAGVTLKPTLRSWNSNWSNGIERSFNSGETDPYDKEFILRGNNSSVTIDGKGIAKLKGDSPRMYVYDPNKLIKWNNVEVIIYTKRVSETGTKGSQGFVVGVRSEHQNVNVDKPCLGRTYYGRILYDGKALLQKELIHDLAYSENKPTENNKIGWGTTDGTLPKNIWIGIKFTVRTNPDNKSVKLKLYTDMTDGKNGGTWIVAAEYTDDGNWLQSNTTIDVYKKCGFHENDVLINPGTSVFVRNDLISEAQYKNFSIREIE